MNNTNKYAIRGLLVFIFTTVSMLATLYAAQAETFTILLFACVIVSIVLSLVMLIFLMQANSDISKLDEELHRLREREQLMHKDNQKTNDNWQNKEIFRVDEVLARVMPAGNSFDSAVAYTESILKNIAKELEIVQGLFFVLNDTDKMFQISGQYAYYSEEQPRSFILGETISGQVAKNQQLLNLKELPQGYVTVLSGLGKSKPAHLVIAPIVCNGESIGIIELASFKVFGENEELLTRKICEATADLLNELRIKMI